MPNNKQQKRMRRQKLDKLIQQYTKKIKEAIFRHR